MIQTMLRQRMMDTDAYFYGASVRIVEATPEVVEALRQAELPVLDLVKTVNAWKCVPGTTIDNIADAGDLQRYDAAVERELHHGLAEHIVKEFS